MEELGQRSKMLARSSQGDAEAFDWELEGGGAHLLGHTLPSQA